MLFHHWFWGLPDNPSLGVTKLHARLLADLAQVDELLAFVNQRVAAEEQYAARLAEIGRMPLRSDTAADDSLVTNIFQTYRHEMAPLASAHQSIADKLSQVVVAPLQRFSDEARRICQPKKDQIDATQKRLDACLAQSQALQQQYIEKSNLALAETKKYETSPLSEDVPTMDVMINMGSRAMTIDEFNDFVLRMQREIEPQDVRSLLGTYKDCYMGDDMLRFVRTKLHIPDADALSFLNDLLNNNFIKPISGRFSHFVPSLQYQWKRVALEVDNEPVHRKAIRDAERAEYEYKKAVVQVEKNRQALDVALSEYMGIAQTLMLERIRTIKDVLVMCVEFERTPTHAIRVVQERLMVFLETLEPEKEIQVLVERDRTGVRMSAPHLFRDFRKGPSNAVFGLSLDALSARTGVRVPSLLRKCLAYTVDVYAAAAELSQNSANKHPELDAWLEPAVNLSTILSLRNQLNSGKVKRSVLRRYPPEIIIGVVKLYLMELPSSVCSDDLYEPLKLLYLSKSEDVGTMRLNSLRSLLATMSSAHFHTLAFVVTYLRNMISGIDPADSRITDLSNVLGPYILRPEAENAVSVHDKHRGRLVRDLIVHFDEIVSPDILSASNSAEELPDGVMPPPKSPALLDSDDDDDDDENTEASIAGGSASSPSPPIVVVDPPAQSAAASMISSFTSFGFGPAGASSSSASVYSASASSGATLSTTTKLFEAVLSDESDIEIYNKGNAPSVPFT
nr:hypothetical protein HK105_001474 [Polyrhizophydium stewartii]